MPSRRILALFSLWFLVSGFWFLICAFVNSSLIDSGGRALAEPVMTTPPPLLINEYLADPPDAASGDANRDGIRDSTQDEFIEVVNTTSSPLDIGGFTISDAAQVRFTFPAGKAIPAGEAAIVFGGGMPAGAFGNASANGLVFAAGGAGLSLNNGGDEIRLEDGLGRVVQHIRFGSVEGNANQSLNRNPDAGGLTFSFHVGVALNASLLFSPGAKAGGQPFTVKPVIERLTPASVRAGSGAFALTIAGSNFLPGAVIMLGEVTLATAYRSSLELEAGVSAEFALEGGAFDVRVRNPQGATSKSARLIIFDDPPRIASITPEGVGTGAEGVELMVRGERFQRGATAMIVGETVATRFAGSDLVTALVPDKFFARATSLEVRLVNADGLRSNGATLTVANGPLLTRLPRSRIRAGRGALDLRLGGLAFKPGVVLFANDSALQTSFLSETELSALLPPELTSRPGVVTLQARNPDGGRSNKVTVKVIE